MSIFNGGTLWIQEGPTGFVLRYDLISRALLYCFLAPLLFLAFAQLNVAIGILDKPSAEEAAAEKKKAEQDEKRYAELPQNPIDKFLGAGRTTRNDARRSGRVAVARGLKRADQARSASSGDELRLD